MQTPDATGTAPTIAETLAKFGADDKTGLTDAEVQARLQKYGPNALVEKQKNTFAVLLQYFWGPIPWMIEAAALMAFIAAESAPTGSSSPENATCTTCSTSTLITTPGAATKATECFCVLPKTNRT